MGLKLLARKWLGKGDELQYSTLGLYKNCLLHMRQRALYSEQEWEGRGHSLKMMLIISIKELTSVFSASFCPFGKLKPGVSR